jgi:hypothetical protein
MGAVVAHAELQAHRALRDPDADTAMLLSAIRLMAMDARCATPGVVAVLRAAADAQADPLVCIELEGLAQQVATRATDGKASP